MRSLFIPVLLFCTSIIVLCCDPGLRQPEEFAGLLHRAQELELRHCQLQASLDSLWDTTSLRLERALPAGFPAMDRAIFLKARNADHIRMFMSFNQLDPSTQSLVKDAGQYDKILAAQMRTLLGQMEEFERQKSQFLQKTARKDLATGRAYADELRKAPTGMCK